MRATFLGLTVLAALTMPATAESRFGNILAGRAALADYDFAATARYMEAAIADNPGAFDYVQMALTAEVALGNFDKALPLAKTLKEAQQDAAFVGLTLLVDAVEREAWDEVIAIVNDGGTLVPAVNDLFAGWAEVGRGNMEAALAHFDALAEQPGSRARAMTAKAYALALAGDLDGALAILLPSPDAPLAEQRRLTFAIAEILSGLERGPEAAEFLAKRVREGTEPPVDALLARLRAGEPLPFTTVRSPRDGIAETLLTIVPSLDENTPATIFLALAQAGLALRPDLSDARIYAGTALGELERFDEAAAMFDAVPKGDLAYQAAQLARSEALVFGGREDEAITLLSALQADYPKLVSVPINLGDVLRGEKRFEEAIVAYDAAAALFGDSADEFWVVYFYRGICEERLGRWEAAEADLRRALVLSKDNPQVLNYLGYSLVEHKQDLEEALKMIGLAVAARPENGAFLDSLGWAHFRLGNYDEAIVHMQKAMGLDHSDPTVNDHLADVYWALGQPDLARLYWKRALSLGPEEPELTRIRRKLDIGLDAILVEEGAPPLADVGQL